MSERLGSLPSDKKKEFTPAWGFNAAAERNYGESHTCNTARAGDLSSHNAFGEVEGAGRVEGAASFEGAGEGSLPETWKEYQEPVDRRTWNKRAHDKTGLSAKQKLQCLAAPAGKHDSLAGGLVAPRNFEVIEPVVEAVSYVVPEDVRLVVASAVAHTPGAAHHVSLVVDNLEESGGEGAAAFPPPAARRSFYALLTPHAAAPAPAGAPAANACAQWVAGALPRLLARHLEGVRESAAIKEAMKAAFDECDAQLLAECARHGWVDGCGVVRPLLDLSPSLSLRLRRRLRLRLSLSLRLRLSPSPSLSLSPSLSRWGCCSTCTARRRARTWRAWARRRPSRAPRSLWAWARAR